MFSNLNPLGASLDYIEGRSPEELKQIAKQQKNQWKRTVVDKFERLRKVK